MSSKLNLDRNFDLYTHYKSNLKNYTNFCELHDSLLTTYCHDCKKSICEVCRDSFHNQTHIINEKSSINLSKNYINSLFTELENLLRDTDVFTQPETTLKKVKKRINEEFDEMAQKIEDLRQRRINEIERLFGIPKPNPEILNSHIKKTKQYFQRYFEKQKEFFKFEDIDDTDNFSFLTNFDVINQALLKCNEYISLVRLIKDQFRNYESSTENKYDKITRAIDDCIEEQKKIEIQYSNLIILEGVDNDEIDMNLNHESKTNSKAKPNEGEEFKNALMINYERLNEDFFDDIRKKMDKFSEHTDIFKSHVFDLYKKSGSLFELEKLLKINEEKISKRIQYNSQAKIVGQMSSKGSALVRSKQQLKLPTIEEKKDNEESPPKKKVGSYLETKKEVVESKHKNKNDKTKAKVNVNTKSPKKEKQVKEYYISPIKKKRIEVMDTLQEEEDETDKHTKDINVRLQNNNTEEEDENSDNSQVDFNDNVEIDVGFSKNKKLFDDKVLLKLNNMFRPKQKTSKKPQPENDTWHISSLPPKRTECSPLSEDKFNSKKMEEILRENIKIKEMLKRREDVNLAIPVIKKYYAFDILEYVKKNFAKINKSSHLLSGNYSAVSQDDNIRIFEGTADIQIYDRDKRKIIRKTIEIDKKIFGSSTFHIGSRTFFTGDRLYITGGKDINGDKRAFWVYNISENKLLKLFDMNFARSFHTIIYNESLRGLIVFGGENNATCEMYDFYLNIWSQLPEMNFARANPQIYIDKVGTYAFSICGILGNIVSPSYSDNIELLDLVDLNKGWAIVDYNNKSNVDLRMRENRIYPLNEDNLLIYGANESRTVNKVYVIFNLRNFEMATVHVDDLEEVKLLSTLPKPNKDLLKESKSYDDRGKKIARKVSFTSK